MDLCSEQALLHKSNVSEDEPVADADDDERQYHADDDEEDGVVAVSYTHLTLPTILRV